MDIMARGGFGNWPAKGRTEEILTIGGLGHNAEISSIIC